MSQQAPSPVPLHGGGRRIHLVAARWNAVHVDRLLERARATLCAAGVAPADVAVWRVPGSHEIPWAAQAAARTPGVDAVIALGVLVRGGTSHHEVVGTAVTHALLRVALETGVPVINGVLTVESELQAEERCGPAQDRGAEFARSALEMAALRAAPPA